jgi:hypothetical protein
VETTAPFLTRLRARTTPPRTSRGFYERSEIGLRDDLTRTSEGKSSLFLLECRRASLLPLRRRWQTRARCSATTYLSGLSCEPKRLSIGAQVFTLRRLTPLEVVWHRGDPPVHYRPITEAEADFGETRQRPPREAVTAIWSPRTGIQGTTAQQWPPRL